LPGCTYEQYLNVESGRSVPQAPLLEKIVVALRVWLKPATAREFFLCYLKLALKSDHLVELLTQALGPQGDKAGAQTPLRQALQKHTDMRRVDLRRDQAALILSSPAHFWCFNVFSNDKGEWGPEELSKLLDFQPKQVKTCLPQLHKAGLLIPGSDGRYRCIAADVFWFPGTELYNPDETPREGTYRHHVVSLTQKRGALELYEPLVLRASAGALRGYYPYLTQTVLGADVYSSAERGKDTALYVIETLVHRLFPM
jgi:hypothetical protein